MPIIAAIAANQAVRVSNPAGANLDMGVVRLLSRTGTSGKNWGAGSAAHLLERHAYNIASCCREALMF